MERLRSQEKLICFLIFIAIAGSPSRLLGSDFERKPIEYSKRQGDNEVSRLKSKLERGEIKLTYDGQLGYLPSLLKELEISAETQTLVFSKTSLQRNRISPQTPRAIYFNDNVYVGFCRFGDVLELSVADRDLGTEFYTLSQNPDEKVPSLTRQTESCLVCHGASATHGLPGHLIRSVYTAQDGTPVLSLGSHRIDMTSPWTKRFGGWYISGRHGAEPHLGNLVLKEDPTDRFPERRPEAIDNQRGQNVIDLKDRFDTRGYLSPHSDLVAHLVLTHQTQVHNLLVKLNIETQFALYEEKELNRELKEEGRQWESTRRRIRNHATDLVQALFFCNEAELKEKVEGTSAFAKEFPKAGPRDSRGRSLRDLELEHRTMKYPCSYLVYSESFSSLPTEAKREVLRQMKEILLDGNRNDSNESLPVSGPKSFPATPHLSMEDRRAISEILEETLDGWKRLGE